MSRSDKKQRAREREERARQRENENSYDYSDESGKNSIVKAGGSKKKTSSNGMIFLKTFIMAFAILTVISFGVTSMVGKVADYNPFAAGDEYTPVLEEELQLEQLVDENSPFFQAFKDAKRANILLIGVNGGLTDTIMLVSFDMENKTVAVISIPRDTYYHRPGYDSLSEKKLNAAYRKNPVNTARAVSDILMGMPINYYAVVEYDGVEAIVDEMGGVPMHIEKPMKYKDPYDKPPLVIDIPAGDILLDGEHAVQFLRYRHGYADGDLGRVKAQQEFVKSAFRQTIGLNLPSIAKTVFQNVDSDITIGTALSLATKAVGMSSDSITTYTIPNRPDPDPPYYVYPKDEEIKEMLREIYSVEPETTSGGGIGGTTETE